MRGQISSYNTLASSMTEYTSIRRKKRSESGQPLWMTTFALEGTTVATIYQDVEGWSGE